MEPSIFELGQTPTPPRVRTHQELPRVDHTESPQHAQQPAPIPAS